MFPQQGLFDANMVRMITVAQSPPGVKQNLMRTYDTWTPEYIAKGGNVVRAQALFALAWLHAVMQERRMYIPQVGPSGRFLTQTKNMSLRDDQC